LYTDAIIWWTALLLILGVALALYACSRVHGLWLVLAIIMAICFSCGSCVLCYGSMQMTAYLATIETVTSQADRANQVLSVFGIGARRAETKDVVIEMKENNV